MSSQTKIVSTREDCVKELSLAESSPRVARRLLGCFLVRRIDDCLLKARIVETEAYREDDPASHSYRGVTPRSQVMFGPPGYWYVYKCYGIHWMINVVCGPVNSGEAVLIRAAQPCSGKEVMQKFRNKTGKKLTNGPGKLAEALQVDESFNRQPVEPGSNFYLQPAKSAEKIYSTRRIGIKEEQIRPWRFFIDGKFVTETEYNEQARLEN